MTPGRKSLSLALLPAVVVVVLFIVWNKKEGPSAGATASFTPVNELERMLLAASLDPKAKDAFFDVLANSDVYVLGELRGQGEGDVVPQAGASAKFRGWKESDRTYIPIYTSVGRLQQSGLEEISPYQRVLVVRNVHCQCYGDHQSPFQRRLRLGRKDMESVQQKKRKENGA